MLAMLLMMLLLVFLDPLRFTLYVPSLLAAGWGRPLLGLR